ncbi:MAG: MarR family winged helix-turn-helix transcriptional regulator [Mangrovibacterium sp.]
MGSPFNPEIQERTENKIIVALERLSEAFRVLLWQESKETLLSPIQVQILIFLLFHRKDHCKVSYLSDEFNMTKATISESIKVLLRKNLVQKDEDPRDTRSVVITLTPEGKRVAERSSAFTTVLEVAAGHLNEGQKSIMFNGLIQLINALNQAGIITVQRMCFSCKFYRLTAGGHFCELMQKPLADSEIRIDCAEHEPV